jgi:Na+-transporting NADH:ubiquinone oxidoreductase subunit NqrF
MNKVLTVTVSVPPSNTSGVCKDTLFTFKMTKLPTVNPFTISFSKDTDANIVAVGGNNMLGQTFAGTFTSSSN